MKYLVILILTLFLVGFTTQVPHASASTSILPYLQGDTWTMSTTTTWTTQGSGKDDGSYKKVIVETDAYTLTDVSETSFTVSISNSASETETASGTWVSPSNYVKCDGCTGTGSWSSSGTETFSLPSLTVTSATGDYANGNVGHAISPVLMPESLGTGKQVGYYWYDQNGNYETVQYSFSGEKMLSIEGQQAKTYVMVYTGTSQGNWQVSGGQSSTGQLTHTVYCDESTGVILGRHYEGTFSLQRSGGGWQETYMVDGTATSTSFKIGSYVIVNSNPGMAPMDVDGSNVSDYPHLFIWDWGSSHTLAAPQTYSVSQGTRIVFTNWDDGNSQSTRTVLDEPGTYTAQFKTQYLLTVSSPYGGTFGSGWYDKGSTATIHADSNVMFFYDFTGWSGSALPASPDTQITMTGPLTIQANYTLDLVRVGIVIIIIVAAIAGVLFYHRRRSAPTPQVYTPTPTPSIPAPSIPLPHATVCNSCGSVIPAGSRFCRKCGARQSA